MYSYWEKKKNRWAKRKVIHNSYPYKEILVKSSKYVYVYVYVYAGKHSWTHTSHKHVSQWMAQEMVWMEDQHLEPSDLARICNFLPKVYEIINACTLKGLENQTHKTEGHLWRGRRRIPLIYFSLPSPTNYPESMKSQFRLPFELRLHC